MTDRKLEYIRQVPAYIFQNPLYASVASGCHLTKGLILDAFRQFHTTGSYNYTLFIDFSTEEVKIMTYYIGFHKACVDKGCDITEFTQDAIDEMYKTLTSK